MKIDIPDIVTPFGLFNRKIDSIPGNKKASASMPHMKCNACQKSPNRLLPCQCRGARYCNAGCQKEHWPVHRGECTVHLAKKIEGSPDKNSVVDDMLKLGCLYEMHGEFSRAEEVYAKLLLVATTHKNNGAMAAVYVNMGCLYDTMRRLDDAMTMYLMAKSLFRKLTGEGTREMAMVMSNMALLHGSRREYDDALEVMEKVIAIHVGIDGPETEEVAKALTNCSRMYVMKNEPDRALVLQERANGIMRKIKWNGMDAGTQLCSGLNNEADILFVNGRVQEALPKLHEALALCRVTHSIKRHPSAGYIYRRISRVHHKLGDHDGAFKALSKALGVFKRAFGWEHPDVSRCLQGLALLESEKGGDDSMKSATKYMKKALEIMNHVGDRIESDGEAFGGMDYEAHACEVASIMHSTGAIMATTMQIEDSIRYLQRAGEIYAGLGNRFSGELKEVADMIKLVERGNESNDVASKVKDMVAGRVEKETVMN